MITAIKHVSIPVKDQDKSVQFYRDKLGFTLMCDVPFGPGQRWIEMKIPQGETQIVLFTPEGHENRIGTFTPIVFTCPNLQETYTELLSRGVEFVHPPKQESWGAFTLFKDVDGNLFCLSSKK